jgi:ribosomal protein S18 acetylase RimI-like enzyme
MTSSLPNQGLSAGARIAPLGPDDLEGFWRCLDAVARERRFLAFTHAPSLEATRAFVEANRAGGAPAFVAKVGGTVAGWCDLTRPDWEGWRHAARLGMGVHPVYRGAGIGRALLEATLAAARARGIERIELEVYASNGPARHLYERAGFEVEGIRRRCRKLGGRYDDAVLMAILLDPASP